MTQIDTNVTLFFLVSNE